MFGIAAKRDAFADYEVLTIGVEDRLVTSEEGLQIMTSTTLADSPELDILIVPSSHNMAPLTENAKVVAFVRRQGQQASYVASNCSGAFLLGEAGLLDDHRATTYPGGGSSLQSKYPNATIVDDPGINVIIDGNLITSNGALVSYEAALLLLAQLTDSTFANEVAEEIYYDRLSKHD